MRKIFSLLLVLLIPLMVFASRPKVALVLSGGGARGISQIPIIKELEKRGIYPDIVTGTSIGALIGALYAAGYSGDEIEQIVKSENLADIIFNLKSEENNLDLPFSNYDRTQISLSITKHGLGLNNSLLDDSKVEELIKRKLAKVLDINSFDDLSIPFRCVGTDFVTGKAIVFSDNLYSSLRSSMSLPLIFSPQQLPDGRYVVDGGLVDNLPASIARELGADIIIAVDVNESVRANANEPQYLETLSGVATQLVILVSMGNVSNEYQLSDYILIPETGNISVIDFNSIDEILKVGEAFVNDNIKIFDEIEESIKDYLPLERPLSYSQRQYLFIEDVVLPKSLAKYEKLFTQFENRAFNESYVSDIASILSLIKHRENLKNISYDISNGVLTVDIKRYEERVVNISIGVSADLFYRNNKSGQYLFLNPGVTVSSSYYINGSKLTGKMRVGNINLLALEYSYPLDKLLDLSFSLEGGFGSYSSDSIFEVVNHTTSQDGRLSFLTSFTSNITNKKRFNLAINTSMTKLDVFSSNTYLYYAGLAIAYSARSSVHSLDLLLQAGYDGAFCYSFKGDFNFNFNDLGLSLALRTIREDERLASAYDVDIFSLLAKDRIKFELSYKLFKSNYCTLLLGAFFDINDNGKTTSLIPFVSLDSLKFGPTLSFDIIYSDLVNISLIAALSTDKELSIGMTIR